MRWRAACQASGREEEALAAYHATIEMAPGYVPAHREFNRLAHAMGRDVLQAQSYAFARSQVGDAPELLLAEADLMLRFNQTEHARMLLTRSRQAFGDSASVANAMGRALGSESRLEKRRRNSTAPSNWSRAMVGHRQELAAVLLRAGKYDAARDALLRALGLAPHDQITLAYLTLAYRHSGDSRLAEIFQPQNFVREYQLRVPAGFRDAAAFNAALAAELERLHTRRVEPIDQTLARRQPDAGGAVRPALARNRPAARCHPRGRRRLHQGPAGGRPPSLPARKQDDFHLLRFLVLPAAQRRLPHQPHPRQGLDQLCLLCRPARCRGRRWPGRADLRPIEIPAGQ